MIIFSQCNCLLEKQKEFTQKLFKLMRFYKAAIYNIDI